MTDPNATIPPLGARTPRNMLRWLLAWSRVHDVAAAIIGGVLAGWILGKLL